MQFPQETIDWAKKKAEEIKKEYSKGLFNQAYGVYGKSQSIPYDFVKFLEKNKWSPLPHECETINCQSGAAVSFVMAKELNLKPKLYGIVGLREKDNPPSGFHFLIIVNVGRKNDLIIDPRYSLFGYCKIEGNKIKIIDNEITQHKCMEFDALIPFTEEEYGSKVEQQRKPEGRISVIYDGQSLGQYHIDHWLSSRFWKADFYLKYNPETNVIETRGVYDRLLLQKRVIILKSKLDEKGDVESRTLSFYYAKKHNWMDFSDLKHFATLPAEKVFSLNSLKNLKIKDAVSLDTVVRSLIFSGCSSDSLNEKTENVFSYLEQISQVCDESFSVFLENATSKEQRMLAAEAGYQKAKGRKESFKSHDELCSICEEWMKEYQRILEKINSLSTKAYLTKSRMKITPHIWQRLRNLNKKRNELSGRLENTSALHKYDPETRFEAILDRYAYSEEVKSSPPKIEDFTSNELKSAYSGMLLEFLALSVDSSKKLLMKKDKRNKFSLEERVLNAVKAHLNPGSVIVVPEINEELRTVEGAEQLIENSV